MIRDTDECIYANGNNYTKNKQRPIRDLRPRLRPALSFFTWYTVRLIWLNLTREDAAAYRSFGMLIGAIAFPLAAIIFGFISWYFINKARNGFRKR